MDKIENLIQTRKKNQENSSIHAVPYKKHHSKSDSLLSCHPITPKDNLSYT